MERSVMSSSFLCIFLILAMSFLGSESRMVRNEDPSSTHFASAGSLFLISSSPTLKHNLMHRRVSANNKGSYTTTIGGFRYGNINAKTNEYRPLRVSPGGPDGHHHFKNINVSKRT
ncbi:hypothetical protein G2W53_042463 [Senna tora]|uniref:Uncharacterized protein n=1 Tax=Senna tora TaxID=362788 RepID=A0A834SGZ3_9FABA|nr:hypothetical protein G2W53_042463 [Senna tora]